MKKAARFAPLMLPLAMGLALSAATPKPLHPSVLSVGDPELFKTSDVDVELVRGRVSKNRSMGAAADGHFTSGVYSSQMGMGNIESYPVDEFMYFIEGDMILSSADGTVTALKAGDAVHVPRGWKGRWETNGYTKFYAVYDHGRPE